MPVGRDDLNLIGQCCIPSKLFGKRSASIIPPP
jgi:hypothetical protein